MNNERYAGNVTKTATMGVGMVGALMTIVVFIAHRFGFELPGDVQAAISTLILGGTAYIFGRNAVGDKAHTENIVSDAVESHVGDAVHKAVSAVDFYEAMEAIARGVVGEPAPEHVSEVKPNPTDSMREQWEKEALGGRQYRYGEEGAPEGGAPGQIYDPRVGWVDEVEDQFPNDSVAH
nr:MAG TPA: hypothetical protein [Caudoviricetes sp.]